MEALSDRLISWLRTVVPVAWSTLVAWLVSLGLPDQLVAAADQLGGYVVVPLATALVYAGLRWVEPRLPGWLTTVLLGAPVPPTYRAPRLVDPEHPSLGGPRS